MDTPQAPGPHPSPPSGQVVWLHPAAPPKSVEGAPCNGGCMVAAPASVTGWRHPWVVRGLSRLARRWIAPGVGCDAQLQAQPPSSGL
ncbi:MAG: hypothetical protein KKG12_07775 [Gammaproteobacteria bacterium]|uniref:hypothetical protein n=1 Tax=Acidovorax sp. JG5 TaxID=2822718 RepID=UPI001B3191D3|nr:hypothetical protein [Acidovorax sp. JG5]MBP3982751.1 hypothetical protein [Acidovorax sp. JG5]MBU4423650.1 hypothetical protein [Gammaproteobacteria bacterium]